MSLKEKLVAQIRATGPIGLDAYISACLHDPEFGYYSTRPRLGALNCELPEAPR